MQLSNFNLILAYDNLMKYVDYKLPQKIGYAISHNMKVLAKCIEDYQNKLRAIYEKYNLYLMKDSDGEFVIGSNGFPVVNDTMREEYYNEISLILNEIVYADTKQVDESSFDYSDEKYDPLSPADINVLQSLLCE